MNKKLVIAVVAVVAVIGLMLGVYFGTRPQSSTDEKTFTITVVHSDGSEKEKTVTTTEEKLAPALIAEGILTDDGVETGMYLIVDGEASTYDVNGSWWALYIDGSQAMEGMNTLSIVDGTEYKLVYTIGFGE